MTPKTLTASACALLLLLAGCAAAPSAPAPERETTPPVVASETPSEVAQAPALRDLAGPAPSWLATAAAPYKRGDLLEVLPASCEKRVYVDVAALLGDSAPDVRRVINQAIAAGMDEPRRMQFAVAMRAVDEAANDPAWSVREIATCDAPQGLIAVGFAPKTTVEVPVLFQQVLTALGEEPGVATRSGDLSLLASAGKLFVQPSAQVVVLSNDADKQLVLDSIAKRAGAPGFTAAKGQLVYVEIRSELDASLVERDRKLEGRATIHLGGKEAAEAQKNPARIAKNAKDALRSVADRLKGSRLEPLAKPIQAVTISIRGKDVVMVGSVERALLSSVVKSLSYADLDRFLPGMR